MLHITPAYCDPALRVFFEIPEARVDEILATIEERKEFHWEDRTEDKTAYWGDFSNYYCLFGHTEKGSGIEIEVWPHADGLDRFDYTKTPSEMSLSQRLEVAKIIRAFL